MSGEEQPKRPRGRPKGSKVLKTAQIAMKAAAEGIQPIEVVLNVMRDHWDKKEYKEAAEMAAVVLPYTTPRLASTVLTHKDAIDDLNVDQLRSLLAIAEHSASFVREEDTGEAGAEASGNSYH